MKIIKEFASWLQKNGFIKDDTYNIVVPRQTLEAREEEEGEKAFTKKQVKVIREELERKVNDSEGSQKVN